MVGQGIIAALERRVPEDLRIDLDVRRRSMLALGIAATISGFCVPVAILVFLVASPEDRLLGAINTLITALLAGATGPLLLLFQTLGDAPQMLRDLVRVEHPVALATATAIVVILVLTAPTSSATARWRSRTSRSAATTSSPRTCVGSTAPANSLRPTADRNGTELIMQTSADLVVAGLDRARVRQIVHSLVSNAIKFTRRGSVRVQARRTPAGLEISVQDTGIGIAPDKLELIFLPFTQADPSRTRRYEGSGLGLAIARRLCEVMGGTLSVTSTPNRGSTFTVRLPCTPALM